MFKWFRLGNKYILVIGGCLLMVAFLIQPVLSVFTPNPANQVLGTLGDHPITLGDQQFANRDLELLARASPLLSMLCPKEPLAWLLMNREAQALGVYASNEQVANLTSSLGLDQASLTKLGTPFFMTTGQIHEVFRRWLIVQQYQELIQGSTHHPIIEKLCVLGDMRLQISQMLPKAQKFMKQYYLSMFYQRLAQAQAGTPRISRPLLEHFIDDHQTSVKLALVPVSARRYLDKVKDIPESQLESLFEKYKNDLPGTSKPYGFGYRIPEHVRLEYLRLPTARVRSLVSIPESQAIDYYDAHIDEFSEPVPVTKNAATSKPSSSPQRRIKPYAQVRDTIRSRLREREASKLADQIIKAAQNLLLKDARKLPMISGYRKIPENFTPTPLESVAKTIQKQFGVLPDIVIDDQQWYTIDQLRALPGIGQSSLLGKSRVRFADYALSVHRIKRDKPHVHASLRLQVGLASLPLAGADGNRYLFRILDAAGTRVPRSLASVRSQVLKDARLLRAFHLALADRGTWAKRLQKDSLQVIARELGTTVSEPPPFQRRQFMFGSIQVPTVMPVGQDETFIDSVFELVNKIGAAHLTDLATTAPDKRSGVVSAMSKLSLYLVRIDEIKPLTQKQFENIARQPDIMAAMMPRSDSDDDEHNPFSIKALSLRTGYVSQKEKQSSPGDDQSSDDSSPSSNQASIN